MMTERDQQNILRTAETRGRKEGARQRNLEIAKTMLSDGMPVATIAKCTGLTEAEVKALQQN